MITTNMNVTPFIRDSDKVLCFNISIRTKNDGNTTYTSVALTRPQVVSLIKKLKEKI